MSRWTGKQQRGTVRQQRNDRRHAAELRDDTSHAERHTPRPDTDERDCE